MYEGRLTNVFDRRVMITYLNEYMYDFIFNVNQRFFFEKTSIMKSYNTTI